MMCERANQRPRKPVPHRLGDRGLCGGGGLLCLRLGCSHQQLSMLVPCSSTGEWKQLGRWLSLPSTRDLDAPVTGNL